MIEVDNLTKLYGDFIAIEGLSFNVGRGEVVGFLGPNGSGKTTTMRILTGFIPPSHGTVKIAGYNVLSESLKARGYIGYLPETVPLYTDMTVEDYLEYMGTLKGMNKHQIHKRINQVIEQVRLQEYQHSLIGKLSKGYRQRTGLAQAILHEPEVLILDEPTIGIDPIQVVETRDLIKELGRDHTILISSHILSEVSILCQKVLIIDQGELLAEDTPANLSQRLQATDRVEVEIRGDNSTVTTALRAIPDVVDVKSHGNADIHTYTVESRQNIDVREPISHTIVENGWGLLRLTPTAMSLEEIFLQLTTTDEAR
ncbi:ATP-binding cassette domain-containing protein [SAR202 cluster bacterium AD-802-E10_MRT_200m]|nr:ATP-binding cassette domain-containing protein [SAR202 cluster bacterium AD-802-E10_MRT_200m]